MDFNLIPNATPENRTDAVNYLLANLNSGLNVGIDPQISGTGMTGSGILLNRDGTFAIGSAGTSIVNNGAGIFIKGFIVSRYYGNNITTTTYSGVATSFIPYTFTSGNFVLTSGHIDISWMGKIYLTTGNVRNNAYESVFTIRVFRVSDSEILAYANNSNNTMYPYVGAASNMNIGINVAPIMDLTSYVGTNVFVEFVGNVLVDAVTVTAAFINHSYSVREINI